MNSILIEVERLQPNTGQIDGLPKNPRKFGKKDVERIAKSIEETPELAEMRPLLVFPLGEKFIVLGGNLRLQGFLSLGLRECPCVIIPESTGVEKLKEIAIKDNGSFGEWDFDALSVDWGEAPLIDWGVGEWVNDVQNDEENDVCPDDFDDKFSLPNEGKAEFGMMTFTVTETQRDFINSCISLATHCEGMAEVTDNKNENGAALFLICKEWLSRFDDTGEKSFDVVEKEYKELRQYLCNALQASGKNQSDVDKLLGTSMSGHYFGESQWSFPSRDAYEKLKTIMTLDRDYLECKQKEKAYNRAKQKEKAYNRAKKITETKNKNNGTL